MTRMLAHLVGFVAIAVLGGCAVQTSSSELEEGVCATSQAVQQAVAEAPCAVTAGGGSGTTTGGGWFSSCAGARLDALDAAASICERSTTCGGTCPNAEHSCVP